LRFPDRVNEHEIELVRRHRQARQRHPKASAKDYIAGYTLGLEHDLPRRRGPQFPQVDRRLCGARPWFVTADEIANPDDLNRHPHVNGVLKQTADTKDLIYDIGRLNRVRLFVLHALSGRCVLHRHAASVSAVKPGDVLRGACAQIGAFEIAARAHLAGG